MSETNGMPLARALQALDEVAAGNYWFVSKGKTTPDEPLFAAAIYPGRAMEEEPLAIAEGDDLMTVVLDCVAQMGGADVPVPRIEGMN